MNFPRHVQNLIANLRGLPEQRGWSKPREMLPLDSVVETLVEKYNIGQEGVEETLMRNWRSAVGGHTAHRCRPQRLIDGGSRLLVFAANAVIRQELEFRKSAIVAKLRELPGCSGIRDLVVRVG